MQIKLIASLIGISILGILIFVILLQKNTITKLRSDKEILSLSNSSLIKNKEIVDNILIDANSRLKICLDSKENFVQELEKARLLIKESATKPAEKERVVEDETRNIIIDRLNDGLL